jgi:hypothetical protein
MKRLIIALILCPIAANAGGYRTVEWFRDHPNERQQTIYWCRNNAGLAQHEPNCRNAQDGAMLSEERRLVQNAPAPYSPVMLNTCRVLAERGVRATPTVAASCHEVGAPGY